MGICPSKGQTVGITIEEFVLDPPYVHELLKDKPVVYIRQKDRLLTFTTTVPLVVGISAVWNQNRYLTLEPSDPDIIEIAVGDNPNYRGFVNNIREVKGQQYVTIDSFDNNGKNMGTAGMLTIEVTQDYAAPDPEKLPFSSFHRPGFKANLSVFLYEAKDISRDLVLDSQDPHVEVDLVLHTNEDIVREPKPMPVDKSLWKKKTRPVNVTWNQGFHWTNLTEEPRFLDVRFNPTSSAWEEKSICRVDLLQADAWGKPQEWRWFPILPEDRRERTNFHLLIVDDGKSGPDLERILRALHYDCDLVVDGQSALDKLKGGDTPLDLYDAIFVNVKQLSGMDGVTFVQRVREMEQHSNATRFITIVATDRKNEHSNESRDRRVLQAQGFDDLMYKPITKLNVKSLVDRYVSNKGLVLLDVVVNYTPENEDGVTSPLAQRRADRAGSDKLWLTANEAATDPQLDPATTPLNGILELHVDSVRLGMNIPPNESVVYVITVNETVLQTNHVKKSVTGPFLANEPIEWHEDVRVWVDNYSDREHRVVPMKLSVSVYAYPPGQDSWKSENLIGIWSSSKDPNFWRSCNAQYHSVMCDLEDRDTENNVMVTGFLQLSCILRPSEEVARRALHWGFVANCDQFGRVGRGEVDRVLKAMEPLVSPPHDESDDYQADGRQVVHKEKFTNPTLSALERWAKDAAHYTPTGQAQFGEEAVQQLMSLEQYSQI